MTQLYMVYSYACIIHEDKSNFEKDLYTGANKRERRNEHNNQESINVQIVF